MSNFVTIASEGFRFYADIDGMTVQIDCSEAAGYKIQTPTNTDQDLTWPSRKERKLQLLS